MTYFDIFTCHGNIKKYLVKIYLLKFKRCAALFASWFDAHAVALMVKLSTLLTQQFRQIHANIHL